QVGGDPADVLFDEPIEQLELACRIDRDLLDLVLAEDLGAEQEAALEADRFRLSTVVEDARRLVRGALGEILDALARPHANAYQTAAEQRVDRRLAPCLRPVETKRVADQLEHRRL